MDIRKVLNKENLLQVNLAARKVRHKESSAQGKFGARKAKHKESLKQGKYTDSEENQVRYETDKISDILHSNFFRSDLCRGAKNTFVMEIIMLLHVINVTINIAIL